MTNAELAGQIVTKAAAIKAKSSSVAVDAWAMEIAALAGQIQPAGTQIIERRDGLERRSGKDGTQQRRITERRVNAWRLVEIA